MKRRRETEALLSVLREARAERPPELDWTRIEEKLEALPKASTAREHTPFRLLLAPVAVAALAGLFYLVRPGGGPAPVAPARVEQTEQATNGDALAPGSVVAAPERQRVVTHAGRVSWTLEPGSRATLLTAGDMLTIRLDQGSVTARVVPSLRPESFAVEAASYRVAAHGTVFRVVVTGERVDVNVSEGTVLVGPRAQPGTGKLLESPASELFLGSEPSAPARSARPPRSATPAAPASASEPAPAADERASEAPVAGAGTGALPAVPEPSPGAVDTAALHVIELTSACFRQRTVAAKAPSAAIQTTLHILARPDGSIKSAQFDPPLPAQVQACISDGVRSLHGPASPNGIEVTRAIALGR